MTCVIGIAALRLSKHTGLPKKIRFSKLSISQNTSMRRITKITCKYYTLGFELKQISSVHTRRRSVLELTVSGIDQVGRRARDRVGECIS